MQFGAACLRSAAVMFGATATQLAQLDAGMAVCFPPPKPPAMTSPSPPRSSPTPLLAAPVLFPPQPARASQPPPPAQLPEASSTAASNPTLVGSTAAVPVVLVLLDPTSPSPSAPAAPAPAPARPPATTAPAPALEVVQSATVSLVQAADSKHTVGSVAPAGGIAPSAVLQPVAAVGGSTAGAPGGPAREPARHGAVRCSPRLAYCAPSCVLPCRIWFCACSPLLNGTPDS